MAHTPRAGDRVKHRQRSTPPGFPTPIASVRCLNNCGECMTSCLLNGCGKKKKKKKLSATQTNELSISRQSSWKLSYSTFDSSSPSIDLDRCQELSGGSRDEAAE